MTKDLKSCFFERDGCYWVMDANSSSTKVATNYTFRPTRLLAMVQSKQRILEGIATVTKKDGSKLEKPYSFNLTHFLTMSSGDPDLVHDYFKSHRGAYKRFLLELVEDIDLPVTVCYDYTGIVYDDKRKPVYISDKVSTNDGFSSKGFLDSYFGVDPKSDPTKYSIGEVRFIQNIIKRHHEYINTSILLWCFGIMANIRFNREVPILFLYGPPGSGKSVSMQYIIAKFFQLKEGLTNIGGSTEQGMYKALHASNVVPLLLDEMKDLRGSKLKDMMSQVIRGNYDRHRAVKGIGKGYKNHRPICIAGERDFEGEQAVMDRMLFLEFDAIQEIKNIPIYKAKLDMLYDIGYQTFEYVMNNEIEYEEFEQLDKHISIRNKATIQFMYNGFLLCNKIYPESITEEQFRDAVNRFIQSVSGKPVVNTLLKMFRTIDQFIGEIRRGERVPMFDNEKFFYFKRNNPSAMVINFERFIGMLENHCGIKINHTTMAHYVSTLNGQKEKRGYAVKGMYGTQWCYQFSTVTIKKMIKVEDFPYLFEDLQHREDVPIPKPQYKWRGKR